jgi:cofilin
MASLQSGISVSDELLALYEDVKLRHKHKFFMFSLKAVGKAGGKDVYDWNIDSKAAKVEDAANKSSWEEMLSLLPADDARFIVFDFADNKADGRQIKKLVLIKWCPDSVSFRLKPVIGATYQVTRISCELVQLVPRPRQVAALQTLKEKLAGLGKDVQAVDHSDLAYEAIKAGL